MVRLVVAVLLLIPSLASAAPFIVTTTADSGVGSLRDAITQANAAPGADTISFAITGTAPYTITLASALPPITGTVTIDGTTQTGFTGAPLVMVDGANMIGTALLLATGSTNSVVRGLSIGHTTVAAIEVGANNCTVAGNYLGLDTTGVTIARNPIGVWVHQLSAVEAPSVTIGGLNQADRNVIGGNTAYGIEIDTGVQGVTVAGNYLGIGADGATPAANTTAGLYLNGGATGNVAVRFNTIAESSYGIQIANATNTVIQSNTIGADTTGMPLPVDIGIDVRTTGNNLDGNDISDAQSAGVLLEAGGNEVHNGILVGNGIAVELESSGNFIRGNAISGNTQGVHGVGTGLANEIDTNSIHDNGDAGLTGSLYPDVPVLTSATIVGTTLAIAGSLTSTPNNDYNVQFFDNHACDPSGAGEGQTALDTTDVPISVSGTNTIMHTVNRAIPEGDVITATATIQNGQSTSAFSMCVEACPVIVVAPASLAISVGAAVSDRATASGGLAAYTFAVSSGSLPAGVSLAADGTLSGTPTSDASATFTITATDRKGCTGSTAYTVQPACPAIAIAPATLPDATGGPYVQQLTASGGAGGATFSATGLPAWLSLGSDGTLSGTPTAAENDSFDVTATDSSGCTGSASYTLAVTCTNGCGGADAGVDGGMSGETGGNGGCCSTGGGLPGGAVVLSALCLGIATRRRRRL